MIILGLTGSIGMGKSTTAKMFADEGVPVHDADATVHLLYEGQAAREIEAVFPGSTRGGKVDRTLLAQQVVGRPEALKALEAIVHPLVRQERERFIAAAERAGATVVVLDVPLLFETGGHADVDAVVVVSAPEHVQRMRVLERGVPADKLDALLARQMPDVEKRAKAHFIVDSGQGLEHARAQVKSILAQVAKMQPKKK
jgi:dephospho-CoA kinase